MGERTENKHGKSIRIGNMTLGFLLFLLLYLLLNIINIMDSFLNVEKKDYQRSVKTRVSSERGQIQPSLKDDTDTSTGALLILPKQECQLWDII